jgi:hypothetical protein
MKFKFAPSGCGCLFLVFTISLLGAIGFVVYYEVYKENFQMRASSQYTDTNALVVNGTPLKIQIARGVSVPIEIQIHNEQAITGFSASQDGLRLVLDGNGLSTVVTPASPPTWNDRIECQKDCNQGIKVPGSLMLPPIPGPEVQTVEGKITGTILYPVGVACTNLSLNGCFENRSMEISIVVQLKVLSAAQYAQFLKEREAADPELVVGMLLLIVAIICGIKGLRTKR